jgi:hypothetical protein
MAGFGYEGGYSNPYKQQDPNPWGGYKSYGGSSGYNSYRKTFGNAAGMDAIKTFKASTGGGTGGAGGGVPQMPYKPEGQQVQDLIDPLAKAGAGLLDPSSAYHQRMRSELTEGIGRTSEAQQRAAALRAAQSGLGAGASPELLETQADIGRSGLESMGDASAQAMLGGIGLGGQLLSPALSGQLGLQGQQLQAYLAQQAALQDQEAMKFQQAMAQQQLQQQMLLQQMALMGGMY